MDTCVENDVEIRCGHFQKIINNCILWNKLTKKYADHSAFCVDHAHIYIYIYFKLLMQDWITLRGHEPLISFFKFLRSHSSLNAKIHTLNDIGIFLKKYHYEANIIFYNLFFYCKSKFTWHICVFRASL